MLPMRFKRRSRPGKHNIYVYILPGSQMTLVTVLIGKGLFLKGLKVEDKQVLGINA